MNITVYGKEGCGKCDAAKDKLERMGIPYSVKALADYIAPTEGWRTGNHVDLVAWHAFRGFQPGHEMPVIGIGSEFYTYSEAMRLLKDGHSKPTVESKSIADTKDAQDQKELNVGQGNAK